MKVYIPINKKGRTDRNGRYYSPGIEKAALEEFVKNHEGQPIYLHLGQSNVSTEVDPLRGIPAKVVGLTDKGLECELMLDCPSGRVLDILAKQGAGFSIRPRYLGDVNENNEVKDLHLVTFDIVAK